MSKSANQTSEESDTNSARDENTTDEDQKAQQPLIEENVLTQQILSTFSISPYQDKLYN